MKVGSLECVYAICSTSILLLGAKLLSLVVGDVAGRRLVGKHSVGLATPTRLETPPSLAPQQITALYPCLDNPFLENRVSFLH